MLVVVFRAMMALEILGSERSTAVAATTVSIIYVIKTPMLPVIVGDMLLIEGGPVLSEPLKPALDDPFMAGFQTGPPKVP